MWMLLCTVSPIQSAFARTRFSKIVTAKHSRVSQYIFAQFKVRLEICLVKVWVPHLFIYLLSDDIVR